MRLVAQQDFVRLKPFVKKRIILPEFDWPGAREQSRLATLLPRKSPERRLVERRPTHTSRNVEVHAMPDRRDIEHRPVDFENEVHGMPIPARPGQSSRKESGYA